MMLNVSLQYDITYKFCSKSQFRQTYGKIIKGIRETSAKHQLEIDIVFITWCPLRKLCDHGYIFVKILDMRLYFEVNGSIYILSETGNRRL